MKTLRNYQVDAINNTITLLNEIDSPILFIMSVGGGKSLCIAEIARYLNLRRRRVLCLVSSAELVRNNSKTYREQGGNPSVFCDSLHSKDHQKSIVFATPQSVASALKHNHPIKDDIFSLIIIDECHQINFKNDTSIYMRILRHYKQHYPPMRVLGLTGTPYRGQNESIIGENAFFKRQACDITTHWLIDNGFLVPIKFGKHAVKELDFKQCNVNRLGKYNQSELNEVTKDKRLTHDILQEVRMIMASRNGAFIFCSSINHCVEALSSLPEGTAQVIIGSTPERLRNITLVNARSGKIKYLIAVNCLMTGVDVPFYDTVVWLRPTESLILFVQGIGRALRLHPSKNYGLVLDYAGNLDRFGDIDDAIINQAIQSDQENEKEYCIPCLSCGVYNTCTARRCRGIEGIKRCEHYFEWRECPGCSLRNDKVSRQCRGCLRELIDPNRKLNLNQGELYEFDVISQKYHATQSANGTIFHITYKLKTGNNVVESFYLYSDLMKNIFWGNFVKKYVKNSSLYYTSLTSLKTLYKIIHSGDIQFIEKIQCRVNQGKYKVTKRFICQTNTI